MKTIISLILWIIVASINGIGAFRSVKELLTVGFVTVIIILLGDEKIK
jgi:hypothetical protein